MKRSDQNGSERAELGRELRDGLKADQATCDRVKRAALEGAKPGRLLLARPSALAGLVAVLVVALGWVFVAYRPGSRSALPSPELRESQDAEGAGAGGVLYSLTNVDGVVVVRRAGQVIALIDRGGEQQ